jgi:hypothetical protein
LAAADPELREAGHIRGDGRPHSDRRIVTAGLQMRWKISSNFTGARKRSESKRAHLQRAWV